MAIRDYLSNLIPSGYAGVDMTPEQQNQIVNDMLIQLGTSMIGPQFTRGGGRYGRAVQDYSAPFRALAALPGLGRAGAREGAQEQLREEEIEESRLQRGRDTEMFDLKKKSEDLTRQLNELRITGAELAIDESKEAKLNREKREKA